MQSKKVRIMVEGAVMLALATALSFIQIYKLPWGGSITLLSMLPIVLFSIRRGVAMGLAVSFLFSLIQLFQGIMDGLFGWGLTPGMLVACIFIDYIFAFTVLGLAGVFRKKGTAGWISGIAIAIALRFVMHFLSGVVIWKSFGELWEGFSTDSSVLYSILYNGSYMLPELIITVIAAVILLNVPEVRKLFRPDED
ncbi:MAG: energy-coupled thiamine transporter ThiT [Lachnospiraceae bacterium]|nr:energy-coupled thiamine transporter ThiT [Lachnospiraceae bacterium]MBQ6024135.1 energy-coupled thiamine transporter ThiT [Lachnospiraceae bacterium]MBR3483743.1 energy-coupled thiamine transporter ThiT [Lachnospiraceae bacterium]MBR3579938.1 energy-coupled thiamine transporter ThiT [Lachnospiraceae bacterium]MBR4540815.1 energy-coupled thiamine transporter ThiT [Lachnospiraceae bacterium]